MYLASAAINAFSAHPRDTKSKAVAFDPFICCVDSLCAWMAQEVGRLYSIRGNEAGEPRGKKRWRE